MGTLLTPTHRSWLFMFTRKYFCVWFRDFVRERTICSFSRATTATLVAALLLVAARYCCCFITSHLHHSEIQTSWEVVGNNSYGYTTQLLSYIERRRRCNVSTYTEHILAEVSRSKGHHRLGCSNMKYICSGKTLVLYSMVCILGVQIKHVKRSKVMLALSNQYTAKSKIPFRTKLPTTN